MLLSSVPPVAALTHPRTQHTPNQQHQQRIADAVDAYAAQQGLPPHHELSPATQPPGKMVMSPPPSRTKSSAGLFGAGSSGGGGVGLVSGLHIDLGCLPAPESRGLSLGPGITLPAPVNTPRPYLSNGHAVPGPLGGPTALAAPALPPAANGTPGPAASVFAAPTAAAAVAAAGGAAAAAAAAVQLLPPSANTTPPRPGGVAASLAASAAALLLDRIQSIKRELGEGEGVSALLERSAKQQAAGGGTVAVEDEALFSDDEFTRPMSPLTRLRYDTFGATLDFVDALCDASSALTSYSQEERHRALRHCLEHINREIDAANRRDVAIWFPMGRGGDRVLRLTAREAVLLNSREKVGEKPGVDHRRRWPRAGWSPGDFGIE